MTDKEVEKQLAKNLKEGFFLSDEAIVFLMKIWKSIQFFDDVADGDKVDRADLNQVLWDHFVGLVEDPFFSKHSAVLKSQLATMIFKWQASDQAERAGEASAKSYMWRAGYYDVVLMVFALVHGHEKASQASKAVMDFYGESFEDYMKEFK